MKFLPSTLALMLYAGGVHAGLDSLCRVDETTIWSCVAGDTRHSLCASAELTESAGYLQYRASHEGKTAFHYPQALVHPRGHFEFRLLPHGAAVFFADGAGQYSISEDVKGGSDIHHAHEGRPAASVSCADTTDSLTKNETITRFRQAGIAQ